MAEANLVPPQGPGAPGQAAAAARPNASLLACLVIVAAPEPEWGLGCRFDLRDVARIGSALDNDIVLAIDGVSPHHAHVERRATAYHLVVDAAGDWPAFTRLGDSLLQGEAALRHGDRLTLGRAGLELLEGHTRAALDEAYHECIHRLTMIDGATGAFNQRYLNDALSREAIRAAHLGTRMALAIFKVDGLTRIDAANDLQDHDDALRSIARRLMAMQRPHDVTARVGADELAVLMPDTSAIAAREWADATRAALETGPAEITVSAGVAVLDAADEKATGLVAEARQQAGIAAVGR